MTVLWVVLAVIVIAVVGIALALRVLRRRLYGEVYPRLRQRIGLV